MKKSNYQWVSCNSGKGKLKEGETVSKIDYHFPKQSIGLVQGDYDSHHFIVWLIGKGEYWVVTKASVETIDITQTGDRYSRKICNVCHVIKDVESFARNQNNLNGIIRRPSCITCRTDIDKRPPKSRQAKQMEKLRPEKGSPFVCPICRRRSITGVTAKVVADHNHHTGDIRGFICDSCNTGLGRFKNGNDYLRNAIAYIEERETLK